MLIFLRKKGTLRVIMIYYMKLIEINVCLQHHHWLCTPLPKSTTSDLYALLEAYVLQVNNALFSIPVRQTNHFHWLFH